MKMYYITATQWDKKQVMCHEFSVHGQGYDGYYMDNDLGFKPKEDIEKYGFSNEGIVFVSAQEVEMIKEFMKTDRFSDKKGVNVANNCPEKWRDAFKYSDKESIEFVEVSFKI